MKWKFRPWPHVAELYPLVAELGIPPLAAAVFWNRGFRSKEDLEPPLTLLPIQGLREAAARILEAIEKKERIRVHGDYDADGLTGTAILLMGLRRLGANIHAFIPHRLDEGYGVRAERVPEHLEACDLFITVDCGITNHAELRELVENGVSVLVTDHHSPGSSRPPGLMVHPALSPNLEGQPHPTGAGVAFLLLWQVYALLGQEPPLEYADLAAIGTVADVAPLQGFNRALVQEGLRRLQDSAHPGLKVLAAEHCREFSATEIAFRIAPRINAASRLGQAEVALQLLTTPDLLEAQARSLELSRLNQERQRIEEEMLERIWPGIDPTHPALVIHDPEGHPGVMGIVASRVLERYYKPVFIIAKGKGSVRSTPGISAVGALQQAASHLKHFGGHAQAAGFAIEEAQIPAFTEAIHRYVAQFPPPEPELLLDGWLDGEDLFAIHQALKRLEPLGEGNPEPLFYTRGRPERVRTLKEGRHLSFYLNGLRVIKWRDNGDRLGVQAKPVCAAPRRGAGDRPLPESIEVAAGLVLNRWNGETSVELWAKSYRPLGEQGPKGPCPEGDRPHGEQGPKGPCPEGDRPLGEQGPKGPCPEGDRPPPMALAEGWAVPVPFSEALKQALTEKARVYVHPEGAAWFTDKGVEVVRAEEATYWFSLPAVPPGAWAQARPEGDRPLGEQGPKGLCPEGDRPTRPAKVRIALSKTALNSLEHHQNPLVQALGRRVAAAYRLGLARELGESLEHYWQALQAYPSEAH